MWNTMESILIISADYKPSYGGIGIHVEHLTDQLLKKGYRVTLLIGRMKKHIDYKTQFNNKNYLIQEQTENLQIIDINTNFSELLSYQEEALLSHLEEKERFDYLTLLINQFFINGAMEFIENNREDYSIIHLHDAFISVAALFLSKYMNIPIVLTVHSMNSDNSWMIENMRRYLTNNVDKIICVSDYIKKQIIKCFNFNDEDKLITIHNAISLKDNNENNTNCVKKEKEIVFCGRLEYVKGTDILIRAFSDLLLRYDSNVQLIIIGSGGEESNLRLLCQALHIEDSVIFTGFLDNLQVREYFREAACVVLPSRKEPFATTALEAMSEGACVVAPNIGGFVELIQPGVNGFIFDGENVDDLAEKLIYILSNKKEADKIGMKAQKEVCSLYSWENISKNIIQVYNEVTKIH